MEFCLKALATLPEVRVAIKCHPAVPSADEIQTALASDMPRSWKFLDRGASLAAVLENASALVYCSGTVALEGLAAGVPVVYVGLEFELGRRPLPDAARFQTEVTTPDQLRSTITAILTGNIVGLDPEEASSIWHQAFEPVTDSSLQDLIQLIGPPS
jgi:hypothetical protein